MAERTTLFRKTFCGGGVVSEEKEVQKRISNFESKEESEVVGFFVF